MKIMTTGARTGLGLAALGMSVGILTAPAALADPADPGPPADSGAQLVSANPAAAPEAAASPPAEVPHLTSPDNLPPGTTATPQQGRGLGYLRDLLHAIRTQDVTANDALLLLAQRPMTANSTPPPGVSAGPSGPVVSSAAAPDADPVPAAP